MLHEALIVEATRLYTNARVGGGYTTADEEYVTIAYAGRPLFVYPSADGGTVRVEDGTNRVLSEGDTEVAALARAIAPSACSRTT